MAGDELSGPISVRARFERFPATVKGAFILRGEDADPHQVVFLRARADGIGLGVSYPVPMGSAVLDVVPHRDVFVPFELPVSELDPGWYTFVCDLEIDGSPASYDGGRRFSVAWPRATVRRGQVAVGEQVELGDVQVRVEHVDCTGDAIKIHLRVDPPAEISAKLAAGGRRLEVLDVELDEVSGRGVVTAYPLLRTHTELRVDLKVRGQGAEGTLEVKLP